MYVCMGICVRFMEICLWVYSGHLTVLVRYKVLTLWQLEEMKNAKTVYSTQKSRVIFSADVDLVEIDWAQYIKNMVR